MKETRFYSIDTLFYFIFRFWRLREGLRPRDERGGGGGRVRVRGLSRQPSIHSPGDMEPPRRRQLAINLKSLAGVSAHFHAECPIWFSMSQLDYSSSTKSGQREEGGVESATSETTFYPGSKITPLNGSPTIPGGNLEHRSLDIVVVHGPCQVLQGSDWNKQRIFRRS